jgi:hypothetical protein
MNDHPAQRVTKALIVGDSGSGKTALLGSLANAGLKIRVLDFDDGLQILLDPAYLKPEARQNVSYVTLRDTLTKATAFSRAVSLLSNWKTETEDFGPVSTWGDDTVLVIDTLNFMSKAALKAAKAKAGKSLTQKASLAEWGDALADVENVVSWLTGSDVKCNLVANTHIKHIEDEDGISKAYPAIEGQNLAKQIAGYFNTVVRIDPKKDGKRIIRTVSDHKMSLKTPSSTIPAEIEPNLALLFSYVRGQPTT